MDVISLKEEGLEKVCKTFASKEVGNKTHPLKIFTVVCHVLHKRVYLFAAQYHYKWYQKLKNWYLDWFNCLLTLIFLVQRCRERPKNWEMLFPCSLVLSISELKSSGSMYRHLACLYDTIMIWNQIIFPPATLPPRGNFRKLQYLHVVVISGQRFCNWHLLCSLYLDLVFCVLWGLCFPSSPDKVLSIIAPQW